MREPAAPPPPSRGRARRPPPALPLGHAACAALDARANDFLRKTGQRRDYFVPATEMLAAWLRAHADLSEEGEARLREAIAQRDRRRFAE